MYIPKTEDQRYIEKELSTKDFTVLNVDYLNDGRLGITLEHNGVQKQGMVYVRDFANIRTAEQALIKTLTK
jgi:hypothetical protein